MATANRGKKQDVACLPVDLIAIGLVHNIAMFISLHTHRFVTLERLPQTNATTSMSCLISLHGQGV
jgi:hypothetical protein